MNGGAILTCDSCNGMFEVIRDMASKELYCPYCSHLNE